MSDYTSSAEAPQPGRTGGKGSQGGTCPQGGSLGKASTGGAVGLSTGHNSPQGVASFWDGGNLLKVAKPKSLAPMTSKLERSSKRGAASYSIRSRRRLLHRLAMVNKKAVPLFVTLTYPAEWSNLWETWKRHLDNFDKRFARRFPAGAYIWKMEFQKRGAPHFHLLVWGVEYAHLILWISQAWYEVVDSGDEKHLRAGTRVEWVRSAVDTFKYAGKYLSKQDAAEGQTGRCWGVKHSENMPWAELRQFAITYRQAVDLIRYMRRAARLRGRDYPSLTIMGDASNWLSNFTRLIGSP